MWNAAIRDEKMKKHVDTNNQLLELRNGWKTVFKNLNYK